MPVRTHGRLAAYALITDGAGRVLLTRHSEGRRTSARWLLPGGGLEHGEHPEQAVVREIREETGLVATVGELRVVLSDVTRVGRRRRALHNVRLVYLASIADADSPGRGEPGRPGTVARWCSQREWRVLPLAPFTAEVLLGGPG